MIAAFLGERLTIKSIPLISMLLVLTFIPIGVVLLLDISYFAAYMVIISADVLCAVAWILWIVPMWSYIQKTTPPELLGKVISLLSGLPILASGLGYFLVGILLERFYYVPWLVVFISALICLITILILRKHFIELKVGA